MLLTIPDVARELSVSVSTVKRLVATHKITSIQVGSARRIHPQALVVFLAANTTPAS